MFFLLILLVISFIFFFFNDTATTEIYTLSLHDALPISTGIVRKYSPITRWKADDKMKFSSEMGEDRKSTRLNSSHSQISYAVFCLKKKKKKKKKTKTKNKKTNTKTYNTKYQNNNTQDQK